MGQQLFNGHTKEYWYNRYIRSAEKHNVTIIFDQIELIDYLPIPVVGKDGIGVTWANPIYEWEKTR